MINEWKENMINLDLLIAVEFTLCRTKTDGSGTLSFHTPELTPSQVAKFHEMRNTTGVLAYKIKGSLTKEEEDLLDEIDLEVEGKSKSQRLRNVLFRLYEQQPDGFKTFKDFYSSRMEAFITKIKDRLE